METRKINSGEVELRCQLSDVRIEQRDGETAGRTVTGYAAKFDKWSEPIYGWFIEQIRAGAFDGCDMADTIMCFNHNVDDILARTVSGTLTLSVDEVGLRFEFEAPNTTTGNNMVELLRRGDISQCSFRFVVGKDEWLYADEKNGLKYDQRTILQISKLYDVALVVYPAYQDTEVSVRHLEERKAEYLRSLQPEGGGDTDTGDSDQGDAGQNSERGSDTSGDGQGGKESGPVATTDAPPAPEAEPPATPAPEENGAPPAEDQQEEQPDKDVATAQTDAASEGKVQTCLDYAEPRGGRHEVSTLSRDRLVAVMEIANM